MRISGTRARAGPFGAGIFSKAFVFSKIDIDVRIGIGVRDGDDDHIPAPLLAYEQTRSPAVNGSRASATLQRLRLEVEPTFLLDVARVFVPTLAGAAARPPSSCCPTTFA